MNDADDCFGEERLGALVEEHAHLPSDELRERVLREIEAFVGAAPQHDDMTMILLKVEDMDAAGAAESAAGSRPLRSAPWRTDRADSSSSSARTPTSKRSIVRGLLESARHPVGRRPPTCRTRSFRSPSSGLGEVRISVRADDADEARRIIESHRTELTSGRLVRLRDEFEALQQAIGYRFRDRGLLEHALTHTLARQRGRQRRRRRQRVARVPRRRRARVRRSPTCCSASSRTSTKGRSRRSKASLVSTATLARLAERLGLGEHLLLGRGEEKTGGRRKQALLADGYEALIAAIYLDGGIEQARAFIAARVRRRSSRRCGARRRRRGLQVGAAGARCRRASGRCPSTASPATVGPDHRKQFQVEVVVGGRGRRARRRARARRKRSRKRRGWRSRSCEAQD